MRVGVTAARALIESQLGNADWRCHPFGAGKFSETYSATNADTGEEYVLRIAPPDSMLQLFYEYRMMRQEPAIHARVARETSVPVPRILAHDFSRSRLDRDYLIMPKLTGVPFSQGGLDGSRRDRALREWGGYIAQIHSIADSANRFGYLGEHGCMEPQSTWAAAFRVMFSRELQDIVQCGVYDSQTAAWVLELLEKNLWALDCCRTSHLLHGDIWVTNLLVQPDGRVTGVLDFDRACWGDIEWDLAIADYCGVTTPAFQQGYGSEIRRDGGEAAIRRFFYLVYEHQKYIVISMSQRRSDPPGARRYAAECLSLLRRFAQTGLPSFL